MTRIKHARNMATRNAPCFLQVSCYILSSHG